ncbi:hypothetical protein IKE_06199, partial [Bacillus cereus VD196]
MRKQKKRMDQLKPVNVVTTAAIVATTLFTPIVDVLPGKYNIVHAEETQNPANYHVIDSSNNWEGIFQYTSRPYFPENMGTYKRFKIQDGTRAVYVDLEYYPKVAVETKIRFDADAVIRFHWIEYDFSKGEWNRSDRVNISPDAPKPKAGEWGVWKVTHDQSTKKNTYYLNGQLIGVIDADTLQLKNKTLIQNTVNQNGNSGYVDVEYVYTSDSAISNEKPVITGEDNTTIEQGTSFDPLSGMGATDKEDGDLTGKLKITENNVDSK